MAMPEHLRKQAEEAEKRLQEHGKTEESASETPETEAEVEESAPEPEKSVDWEHKFKVIEGKYRAEVPRLHQENREIRERLEELTRKLEDKPEEKPKKAEESDDFRLLDDYFDKDTRKTLDRYIETKVQSRLGEVKGDVEKTQRMTAAQAEQAFWRDVTRVAPDYQELSVNGEFTDWLSEPVPLTPFTRYQLMMQAYQNRDSDRFVQFITTWKGDRSDKTEPDAGLKKKAIPQKAASTSVPSEGKKVYSRSDIQALGEKARKANLAGKRDEAKRILNEIDAAISDNRVR